jgi:hypothetical protein
MSQKFGTELWSVECADAKAWLQAMPTDSCDLVLTSPPYAEARLYLENGDDLGIARTVDEWVAWCVPIYMECVRVSRGLVAWIVGGSTKNYRWNAAPFLFAAELHRRGVNLRNPVIYYRHSIPGTGGKDWLRANTEYVICANKGGQLPWSDPTACGSPPKYKPGGECSFRMADGTRVNGRQQTPRRAGGKREVQGYVPPKLANPGNVVEEVYTASEVAALLGGDSDVSRHAVGGGRMGHPLATENEAPFPLTLAEFFVKSFCKPDGLVIDPFVGGGTVLHAAIIHGRRGRGCDIRDSQVDLARRRLLDVEGARSA